jgi:uncharacterized protein
MMNANLAQFANQQFLNLETYRKNGQAMRTPVWFAQDGDVLVVHTVAGAGKIKRIRNNSQVRIAPCDMVGNVLGAWVTGEARVLDEAGRARANQLLDAKYGEAMAQFKQRSNLQNAHWDAIEIRV